MPDEALAEELVYYTKNKADLLQKHEGKFALIKGRRLLGVFDSQAAAYSEGLKQLGNAPMLIVRVQAREPRVLIPALQVGLIRADIQA